MGKKKLKKLKKKKIVQPVSTVNMPDLANENVLDTVEREFAVDAPVTPEKAVSAEDEIYLSDEYKHVKTDIRKILIVMAIIIIILFGLYFLDRNYGFLGRIGDYIYKISNIQSS